MNPNNCLAPPPGWTCSRLRGHDGPCAASPIKKSERVLDSADAVAKALGLTPLDEFEYNAFIKLSEREVRDASFVTKETMIKQRYRRSGRTTRIVCQALVHVAKGTPVHLVSFNGEATERMRRLARSYAYFLVLDVSLIRDRGKSRDGCITINDHDHP